MYRLKDVKADEMTEGQFADHVAQADSQFYQHMLGLNGNSQEGSAFSRVQDRIGDFRSKLPLIDVDMGSN